MIRIISTLIVVACCFVAAGCSCNDESSTTNSSTTDSSPIDSATDADDAGADVEIDAAPCNGVLDEDITIDTTISAHCNYIVKVPVVVSAKLTIEPGVTLRFEQDAGLSIDSSGSIVAIGTADDPILMTGDQQTRGHWRGIEIHNSDIADNRLEYVTIEHGGGYAFAYGDHANLSVTSSGFVVRVALANVTLRESAGWGLYLADNAEMAEMTDCTITSNASGPAYVHPQSARFLGGNSFSGNDVDVVYIHGNAVEQDVTWYALDVPYLHGEAATLVSAKLTLEAGIELRFAQDTGLDINAQGTLSAIGEATKPILLRGEQETPGFWRGVEFHNSDKVDNRLEHVTIEHGGGYDFSYGEASNLALTSSGFVVRLAMVDVTLRHSAGLGLFLASNAEMAEMTECTITSNKTGAASVHPHSASFLGGNSFSGNDVDYVFVRDGAVEQDVTWHALDVPYLHQAQTTVSAKLSIAAGAEVHFAQDAGVYVGSSGALQAVGTATEPIILRGEQTSAGYWRGIELYNTSDPDNQLEYVTIEHGGSYDFSYGDPANLALTSSGSPVSATINNCTIRHSAGWGMWQSSRATVTASGNTFSDNASGDVFVEPP